MTEVHIVIDTREQTPWSFPANVQTSIGGISTGDYALYDDLINVGNKETAEPRFAIERKSADDFAGTVSTGWPRFCRELIRMDELRFPNKVIIVESDFETFCFRTRNGEIIPPSHGHFNLTPQFIMRQIGQLTMQGCSVLFAGDAELASALALRIFIERNRQITTEKKKKCN